MYKIRLGVLTYKRRIKPVLFGSKYINLYATFYKLILKIMFCLSDFEVKCVFVAGIIVFVGTVPKRLIQAWNFMFSHLISLFVSW